MNIPILGGETPDQVAVLFINRDGDTRLVQTTRQEQAAFARKMASNRGYRKDGYKTMPVVILSVPKVEQIGAFLKKLALDGNQEARDILEALGVHVEANEPGNVPHDLPQGEEAPLGSPAPM